MSPQSAPKTISRALLAPLCPLFASSLRLFLLSGRFGTILASFGSPWDLENLAFSLRRSSNSSFFLFSPRTLSGSTQIIQTRFKLHTPAPKKISQRSPGALGSVPGEPQELPKTTPGALGGHPWASKKSPGVVLGASGPHFGAPRVGFCQLFILFQRLSALFLFSLLSRFSLECLSS